MSTHYYSQFNDYDDERDYLESDRVDRDDYMDEWGCCFPGNCCMAFCDHMRDECHTPEMAAEWMSDSAD